MPAQRARSLTAYTIEQPNVAPISVARAAFVIGSRSHGPDLSLSDASVSRVHCEITIDEHGHRLRDLGSRNGTFVDGTRVIDAYLKDGATIRVGGVSLKFRLQSSASPVEQSASERIGSLVGSARVMRELFALIERVAPLDTTVLVQGETGTGKELIARAIHERSSRANGALVTFDCSSVAPNLLESELFGHERGAFTGADRRRDGYISEADGGTLFLDEIGELPLELQPKLLRVLEAREYRRVGSTESQRANIRVVAATHRDLAIEVNRGTFREDLYYRLAVLRLFSPPLRERVEDIRMLVAHFISQLVDETARAQATVASIREATWAKLESHGWPGNVRELRNVVERTLVLGQTDAVERVRSIPPAANSQSSEGPRSRVIREGDLLRPLMDVKSEHANALEKSYVEAQLSRFDGNISRAAAASSVERMYFKKIMKRHGVAAIASSASESNDGDADT